MHEPRREEEVLSKLREQNEGPLSDDAVCRVFEAVMKEMRAVQMLKERHAEEIPSNDADSARNSSEVR